MDYAVVVGEALVDMLETRIGDDIGYRSVVGGGPLNVAVGVCRLGGRAELTGSVGHDAFGLRIRTLLRDTGVGDRGLITVETPTTLAVTTFHHSEPEFHFYGQPRSYGLFGPDDLDVDLVRRASVLYCGSIALLEEPVLAAARRAWAISGPLRVFDPNVRPDIAGGVARARTLLEEFAVSADLVKLSVADATAMYDAPPGEVIDRLAGLGAGAVVLTLGGDGAMVQHGGQTASVPGIPVQVVDTTGAGDATMGALIAGLLRRGPGPSRLPGGVEEWARLTAEAMRVAGLVCEAPGGATAMPTREQVIARFGDPPPRSGHP